MLASESKAISRLPDRGSTPLLHALTKSSWKQFDLWAADSEFAQAIIASRLSQA